MPNNRDFSNVKDIKILEVKPVGWVSPLFVEYGLAFYGGQPSYFWRVKGTLHTFIIPVLRMDFLSQGDYAEHFTKVLQEFREDYIQWSNEKFSQEWQAEYRKQYSEFISL